MNTRGDFPPHTNLSLIAVAMTNYATLGLLSREQSQDQEFVENLSIALSQLYNDHASSDKKFASLIPAGDEFGDYCRDHLRDCENILRAHRIYDV
ncbi:hypothetical protein SCBWM1_gp63 [Synechococcus phage S-CBWM1]|uniref:Uncharacterized protein n=1 Tax=Synechococcus phage S-CBWM1 TaxID=2053653 RepID=A0A3G1L3J4_9CAUD|nr:hypothetical protein HOU61_gp134 [Synechococcus phage S-CBWM1]ATW62747.1 hypothetical protein SCBWM1_gp63 [Synechococcus phage S-CBWM1]